MHYCLRFLDPDGQVARTLELGCRNDRRAIAMLNDFASDLACELWQGHRLIRFLESTTRTSQPGRRSSVSGRPGHTRLIARSLPAASSL